MPVNYSTWWKSIKFNKKIIFLNYFPELFSFISQSSKVDKNNEIYAGGFVLTYSPTEFWFQVITQYYTFSVKLNNLWPPPVFLVHKIFFTHSKALTLKVVRYHLRYEKYIYSKIFYKSLWALNKRNKVKFLNFNDFFKKLNYCNEVFIQHKRFFVEFVYDYSENNQNFYTYHLKK